MQRCTARKIILKNLKSETVSGPIHFDFYVTLLAYHLLLPGGSESHGATTTDNNIE
jgi:hypothetical protein